MICAIGSRKRRRTHAAIASCPLSGRTAPCTRTAPPAPPSRLRLVRAGLIHHEPARFVYKRPFFGWGHRVAGVRPPARSAKAMRSAGSGTDADFLHGSLPTWSATWTRRRRPDVPIERREPTPRTSPRFVVEKRRGLLSSWRQVTRMIAPTPRSALRSDRHDRRPPSPSHSGTRSLNLCDALDPYCPRSRLHLLSAAKLRNGHMTLAALRNHLRAQTACARNPYSRCRHR